MKSYSIIRGEEYKKLQDITLNGRILDVGGSKRSGYRELIKGDHTFYGINIDTECEPDLFVDIEKTFPLESNTFDHSVCLNVLEHIFEINTAFGEQVRCVKSGGTLVFATPFMHHVHGSPDDYLRYTESAYRRLAAKFDCTIVSISPLGFGFFSLGYQCIGGALPTAIVRDFFRVIAVSLDKGLNRISNKYRTLTSRIPLGYFVVMTKN